MLQISSKNNIDEFDLNSKEVLKQNRRQAGRQETNLEFSQFSASQKKGRKTLYGGMDARLNASD